MSAGSEASKGASLLAVRKLAGSDVPAVFAMLQESPEAAAWSRESLLQLASADPAAWVVELNGVLVGFLIGRIAADEFEILNMAVSQAHRRSGIGSRLLESALEFSRTVAAPRLFGSARLEWSGLALYKRHGFTECGRRAGYYREPLEDALLLCLRLGGTH